MLKIRLKGAKMKAIKVLFVSAMLLIASMLCTAPVHATMLPWLDFGNNVVWDANSKTLSDGGLANVTSATYIDGSTAGQYSGDPVLGSVTYPPLALHPMPVNFSISFDGNNSNDWISVGSWFHANLNIGSGIADPLSASPNPFVVDIKSAGLFIDTGAGSQWADEFGSRIDYSLLYPAQLSIAWLGSYTIGNDLVKVNASGKVAPVPEPGTLVLLGTG